MDLTDRLRRNPRLKASNAAGVARLEIRLAHIHLIRQDPARALALVGDSIALLHAALVYRPVDPVA